LEVELTNFLRLLTADAPGAIIMAWRNESAGTAGGFRVGQFLPTDP
jgi:hypothetical protein